MLLNGQRLEFTHPRVLKEGVAYWFQKKGYPLTKLGTFQTDDPNTLPAPAFLKVQGAHQRLMRMAMGEAELQIEKVRPGTLGELIVLYRGGERYKKLAPSTRDHYNGTLKKLELLGHLPLASFTPSFVESIFDKAPTAGAKFFLKVVLRILFKMAIKREWMSHNHAADVELESPRKRRRVWTIEEVPMFADKLCEIGEKRGYDPDEIMAMLYLMRWQGQRPSDILALCERNYIRGRLQFRQLKTTRHEEVQDIDMPVHTNAKPYLDKLLKKAHTKRVPNPDARIFTLNSQKWRTLFRDARAALGYGMKDIQTRDLRRTLTSGLAESGATEAEITAITGHSQKSAGQILKHYIITNGRMADNAMAKLGHIEEQPENGAQKKAG